ncbi:MAG: thioredoxin [Deltaproteobacteria bacterium]|nr:thioredoxin [Deltaproteobacteria bacterium]
MKSDRPAWLVNKPAGEPASLVKHVTDASFEREVVGADKPVFVDFWAPWCGPCRMVGPVVEALAKEYEGRIKFVKVDTETNPGVAGAMGIRSIPTLVVFRGKDVVASKIGASSIDELRRMLDAVLGVRKPGLMSKLFG